MKNDTALRFSAAIALALILALAMWAILASVARPGRELSDVAMLNRRLRPSINRATPPLGQLEYNLCSGDLDPAIGVTRAQITAASATDHVTLKQFSLAPSPPAAGQLLSTANVIIRAQGSEANIMRFLGETASARPALVFDRVTLGRSETPAELGLYLEARLVCART